MRRAPHHEERIMFGNVNEVTLLGRLGQKPEIRSTNSGKRVATLSVVTSEYWTDQHTGEKKERPEWHRVVVFIEPIVKALEKHADKGMRVYIRGANRTRDWKDNEKKTRYTTEVVVQRFSDGLQLITDGRRENHDGDTSDSEAGPGYGEGIVPLDDDEIPY
jgi:single-strand DNA-binding protein